MSRPMRRRGEERDERGAAAALRPHVAFTVGAVTFAFDAAHARYVLRGDAHASTVPVRWLDEPYPLIDLRQAFGHPRAAGTGFVLLVESGRRAGLRVDDVRGLSRIDPERLAPLPAIYRGAERRWVAGLASTDDSVTIIVRVAELIDTLLAGDALGAVP